MQWLLRLLHMLPRSKPPMVIKRVTVHAVVTSKSPRNSGIPSDTKELG